MSEEGTSGPPARRLTTRELEAVIRRAVELQAAEGVGGEAGLTDEDVLRIGQELGIPPVHLERALAETGASPEERGALSRLLGPARIRATRSVSRPASEVRVELERYLLDRETLSVQRRFPDRTVYEPAPGVFADMARMMKRGVGRFPLAGARTVEVAVRAHGEDRCFVSMIADLGPNRTGHATGAAAAGAGGGGAVALATGVAVGGPIVLVAIPVAALGAWGVRRGYRETVRRAREKLEGLLDRVEHNEPLLPPPARKLFGFLE